MTISQALMLLGSYLVGSISFGYIVVEIKKGIDIRTKGSKSTGATNVTRELGKTWGKIVMILDGLKGFCISATAIFLFWNNYWIIGLAILLVDVGHVFPIFIKFKGGKGVATFIGALFPLIVFCLLSFTDPWTYIGLAMVIIGWLIIKKIRKIMSLSSIGLMTLLILYFGGLILFTSFSSHYPIAICVIITSLFVIFNHRENIERLWDRKEPTSDLI